MQTVLNSPWLMKCMSSLMCKSHYKKISLYVVLSFPINSCCPCKTLLQRMLDICSLLSQNRYLSYNIYHSVLQLLHYFLSDCELIPFLYPQKNAWFSNIVCWGKRINGQINSGISPSFL